MKSALIGTTATPERLDGLGYDNVFDDVTFRYDLPEAIRDGWLADVRAWRIESDLDLDRVSTRAGDFAQGELQKAIEESNLTAMAAKTWDRSGRRRPNLFFAAGKEHAKQVLEALQAVGAKAALVTEETKPDERRGIVTAYKVGDLEALVNVGVFTEGFDAPDTRAVHILRPTRSRSLFLQMLGRGTRKAPGKDSVDLYDYVRAGTLATGAAAIFGLPDAWQCAGQSLMRDKDELDEIQEKYPLDLSRATSLSEVRTRHTKVALFKFSITDKTLESNLAWMRAPGKDRWYLGWTNPTLNKVSGMDERWRWKTAEVCGRERIFGTAERLELFQNELGAWEVSLSQGKAAPVKIAAAPKRRDTLRNADAWVATRREHRAPLLDRSRPWREQPASEAQKSIVSRWGVPGDIIQNLTKAEASALIDIGRDGARRIFA